MTSPQLPEAQQDGATPSGSEEDRQPMLLLLWMVITAGRGHVGFPECAVTEPVLKPSGGY